MSRRVGRYELVKRLGAGGGGEVWEAVLHGPAGFRRRVAVKLLQDGVDDSVARDALLQEARLGALVAHPNVVSTLELGEHEGRWFLVMDLVQGASASGLRKQGALPPAALLELGIQVCDGLSHIHGLRDHDGWPLGLVHRDIKPGNLMVDTHHRVRIVDLGIARLTGTPEVPAGTPGFVAPEQLRGEEGPRADLFSLGVTLAALGPGVLPFGKGARAVAQVLDVHADARATDPALRATLDAYLPGLGPVVCRAIRADPASRWPSAEAFAQALRGLYGACPTSARLATVAVPTRATDESTGSLTTERGPFVGRRSELAAVEELLDVGTRWVTLVGPGGVGKTRLIDEVTREREAVRCDVSKARTLPGLCHAIAEAVESMAGADPIASVGASLKAAGVRLLVLDEVELVIDAVVDAMPQWLLAAPDLQVVASSRVAPSHPDAALVRVGPLSMADARTLFAMRLGRGVADRVVDPMLRALDRLPLAIELAAARARKTSPERVLAQLEAMSSFQVPGVREALQASWDLLEAADRCALVRLASFEGAFEPEDAVAVIDVERRPLERLERLVEHSMLHVRGNRFRLLTSVRAFARDQLPEERRRGEQRHGKWLARMGTPEQLEAAYQSSWVAAPMVRYLDDLLVASRRAEARGDVELAVVTGLAACQGLFRVGPMSAIEPLVNELLRHGHQHRALYQALGRGRYSVGDVEGAEAALSSAWSISEGIERRRVELNLAAVRYRLGVPGALEMLDGAVEAIEASGEGRSAVHGRTLLGQLLFMQGRVDASEKALLRAVDASVRNGFDVGHARGLLAMVQKRRGRFVAAAATMREAIAELEAGNDTLILAVWLANASYLMMILGEPTAARSMAARARDLGRAVGRKPTEGIALAVLSELAVEEGDRLAARSFAEASMEVARTCPEANLACEAELALARSALIDGRTEEGVEALERAWGCGSQSEGETRAQVALWMARYGPVPRALELVGAVLADEGADDTYQRAVLGLASAELSRRQGRTSEARGALLQGSAELARLELPAHAPLVVAYDALRAAVAR